MNKTVSMLLIWVVIGGVLFLGFQYLHKPSTVLDKVMEKKFISYHDMKDVYENDDEKSQLYITMYLKGMQEGVTFSNAALKTAGNRTFFCIPDNLALSVLDTRNIMEKYYNSLTIEDRKPFDEAPISMIYILSMIHKYPCNK